MTTGNCSKTRINAPLEPPLAATKDWAMRWDRTSMSTGRGTCCNSAAVMRATRSGSTPDVSIGVAVYGGEMDVIGGERAESLVLGMRVITGNMGRDGTCTGPCATIRKKRRKSRP